MYPARFMDRGILRRGQCPHYVLRSPIGHPFRRQMRRNLREGPPWGPTSGFPSWMRSGSCTCEQGLRQLFEERERECGNREIGGFGGTERRQPVQEDPERIKDLQHDECPHRGKSSTNGQNQTKEDLPCKSFQSNGEQLEANPARRFAEISAKGEASPACAL